MKCIFTHGRRAKQLARLARLLDVYEISYTYCPNANICTGEILLSSGKAEHFQADTMEEITDAMVCRLNAINTRRLACLLHNHGGVCNE